MGFDWKENLKLATFLYYGEGLGFSLELRERVAINRAYYSAFCHARDFAGRNIVTSNKGDVHIQVRDYFLYHQNEEFADVGDKLQSMRGWRNNCDYDPIFTSGRFVEDAINYATEIFSTLKAS